MENIKKYQTEVTELNNIIIELKHLIQGFNNRLKQAEVNINVFEDRQ